MEIISSEIYPAVIVLGKDCSLFPREFSLRQNTLQLSKFNSDMDRGISADQRICASVG